MTKIRTRLNCAWHDRKDIVSECLRDPELRNSFDWDIHATRLAVDSDALAWSVLEGCATTADAVGVV